MLLHKFGRNKRGFSTVIAVVLSLVILVVIVANVVLWNYSMSQIDWERTKEDMRITNVVPITSTSWITAQTEYTVDLGHRVSGSYADTKQDGGSCESFAEGLLDVMSYFRRVDLTEVTPPGKLMNVTQPSLGQSEASYLIARGSSVHFYSSVLPSTLMANGTWLLYLWSSTQSSGKSSQLTVQISLVSSNGSLVKATVGAVTNLTIGYGFSERIISIPGNSITTTLGDRLRLTLTAQFAGGNDPQGMSFYYDGYGTYETLDHETRLLQPQGGNGLVFNGPFFIDLSTSSLNVIKSVEVRMVYRASDTNERWYLKAYNWSAGNYGDSDFNNTAGNVPALTWSTYAVNMTGWRDYINANGTLSVRLQDKLADINQTRVDIDFLGVRITVSGAKFTFQNKGPVTLNLVSLWIDNSTVHQRYKVDIFINAGDTVAIVRNDMVLPSKAIVKAVTARGNIAVYATD